MTADTHQTASTQFVEANGIRFAYRRFGKAGGLPIVFNQHYLGTMDYWDPAVTDGLARDREVILFNNAGVSSSSGEVPTTCAAREWGRRRRRPGGSLVPPTTRRNIYCLRFISVRPRGLRRQGWSS